MIEGLHFDISAKELREVLHRRIEQCEEKAKVYLDQAEQQATLTAKLGEDDEDLPKHSGDQSRNLAQKANEYKQKAKEFKFLHDHVIEETYRLSKDNLYYLGILKQRYY